MSSNRDLLIVDDNKTNLILMEGLAKGSVKSCQTFLNGIEALSWCDINQPKLVLIDYMMPDINGLEWIEKLREKNHCKNIPVIMITADSSPELKIKALECGATDFLTKPIEKVEFRLKLKNLMELSLARNDLEEKVRAVTQEIEKREFELIEGISQAAEFRDPETGAHTKRVGHYSRLIAEKLGMTGHFLDDILRAAPMHDLGKIGIPDSILLKNGKLTEEEWVIMRGHPEMGYKIASKSGCSSMQLAAEIALTHHEKFNGKGYPRGMKGDDIPISGRIVALADVFDALSTERPYKKAWPMDQILEEIKKQKGEHFCPKCVDALLENLDEFLKIKMQFPDHE